MVPSKGELVFYKSTLSATFLIVFKNLWQLKSRNVDSGLSLFCYLLQSLIAQHVVFTGGTFREFPLVLCRCCSVLSVKKVWNDFGRFLFIWSYTNCKLLKSTMSFNLQIFYSLYRGALDCHGALKLIIRSALFWIFSILFMAWVRVCPHSWQPYRRWDSKIAEYIVFKSFESTWYLILAKEAICSLLSWSFTCTVKVNPHLGYLYLNKDIMG